MKIFGVIGLILGAIAVILMMLAVGMLVGHGFGSDADPEMCATVFVASAGVLFLLFCGVAITSIDD